MARKRLGSKNMAPTGTPTPTRNSHGFTVSPTSSSSSSGTTCDGDDSSLSISPILSGVGGGLNSDIHHRHNYHRHSHRPSLDMTDEEVPNLLFPLHSVSTSSVSASASLETTTERQKKHLQGRHCSVAHVTNTAVVKFCHRFPPQVRKMGLVLLVGFVIPFVIERMVFSVRYLTMGRPAILYGSPLDWKDVKGCLKPSYRQDVRTFKTWFGNVTQTGMTKYELPLNPNVVWNWYRYSNRSTHDDDNEVENDDGGSDSKQHPSRVPRRRILVAQYSGFGSYSQILQSVSPINLAYCMKWGHDYVTLEGTALQFPGMRGGDNEVDETDERGSSSSCKNKNFEPQSTFNKIPLLVRALEESHRYDQVLILDTDTMIVDFDYDIGRLLLKRSSLNEPAVTIRRDDDNDEKQQQTQHGSDGTDYFLVAYRVWSGDWRHTWDVNAGISLWNLRHPSTAKVAELWLRGSLSHPIDVLLKNDDQFFLQRALIALGWWNRWGGVNAVRDEFEYYDATVIKHFKRDARSWSRTSLEQRLLRIEEAKTEVCRRWSADCERAI